MTEQFRTKYRKQNTWRAQRTTIDPVKKSELTDNPTVLPERMEAIMGYIKKYKKDNGKNPSYTNLNKVHGMRASKKYWDKLKGK